jgi:BioD-like phosphotransacetylase family protein
VITRYYDEVRLLDDILASKTRIGEALLGILINRVSKEGREFIQESARSYLEKKGVRVFGVLPEVNSLSALTVGELVETLHAEILTRYRNLTALVESFTIGAMTQEAALARFRKHPHKAVITGGDRSDIQLAALETSTACLILTGNLRPSPLVVRQAEEFGVTMLLVRTNTMETIERIESIYGKSRLGQEEKLSQFEQLMDENFDYKRLEESLNI